MKQVRHEQLGAIELLLRKRWCGFAVYYELWPATANDTYHENHSLTFMNMVSCSCKWFQSSKLSYTILKKGHAREKTKSWGKCNTHISPENVVFNQGLGWTRSFPFNYNSSSYKDSDNCLLPTCGSSFSLDLLCSNMTALVDKAKLASWVSKNLNSSRSMKRLLLRKQPYRLTSSMLFL